MKMLLWIVVGGVIAVISWVPRNMAGRYDIPFGEAVLAIFGSLVGGIIVVITVVHWVRPGSATGSG